MMVMRNRISIIAIEIIMLLLSLLIIIPFLIMIFGSLKNSIEVTAFDLSLPTEWLWGNYAHVIIEGKMLRSFLNGVFITGVAVILNVILASMASFIIARVKTRLSEFLYYFFFIGMIAPLQLIPMIQLFQSVNMYGSYTSVILVYCIMTLSFSIFLYTGFIKTIPQDLDEVAMLEGASLLRIFFRIIFPLIKPINITVVIIVFMNIWNDINIPIFFLNNPSKWTMPLSVYQFFGMYSGSSWNLVFANLVLTALPVLILYLFCQRYIVAGMTSGAVK